jgi:hypothetical protein
LRLLLPARQHLLHHRGPHRRRQLLHHRRRQLLPRRLELAVLHLQQLHGQLLLPELPGHLEGGWLLLDGAWLRHRPQAGEGQKNCCACHQGRTARPAAQQQDK